MIPNMNLSEVRTESIEAGGYVMRTLRAEIDPKFNRLQLHLDIAEGEHAGYYQRLYEKTGESWWAMILNLYLDKDQWKFARAIDAVKASNDDFTWDDDAENDEQKLVGKYIGIVTRKIEYVGNDGLTKKKLRPYSTHSVQDIREGRYTVPDMLPLIGAPASGIVDTTAGFGPVRDEDMPF